MIFGFQWTIDTRKHLNVQMLNLLSETSVSACAGQTRVSPVVTRNTWRSTCLNPFWYKDDSPFLNKTSLHACDDDDDQFPGRFYGFVDEFFSGFISWTFLRHSRPSSCDLDFAFFCILSVKHSQTSEINDANIFSVLEMNLWLKPLNLIKSRLISLFCFLRWEMFSMFSSENANGQPC